MPLAAALLAFLAAGPALGADMVIKKVDCERWPAIEVEATLPEADEKAGRYSLRLLPEGEPVPAAALSPVGVTLPPLNIVVAVDISKSLPAANLEAAKKALAAYAANLEPEARIAVLAFNDDVRIVAPFALDRALMESALGELKPGGAKTELYRAMLYGLGLLKDQKGRRMLLVISDGHDEGTRVTIAEVIEEARKAEAGISAIGLAAKGERARQHLPVLEGFARDTGGLYRFGDSPAEIAGLPYEIMSARKKTDEDQREHLYRLDFKLPESTLVSRREVQATLTRSLDDRSQSLSLTLKPPAEVVAAGALEEKAAESRNLWLWLGGALAGLFVLVLALLLWRRQAGGGRSAGDKLASAGRTVAMDDRPRSRATEALAGPSLVLEFADLGLSFPLADGKFSLGARPGSDILVDEPTVSGRHAELEIFTKGSEDCRVTDLDSTNGTLVNGIKIGRPTPLKPGDALAFGNARAVLRLVRPAGR
jgi:FOG: FHA domain